MQNKQRKFMFLYLNTGGGHVSAARVLKQSIEDSYDTAVVELLNGFDRSNSHLKLFFEKGYHAALTFAPGAFSLIYEAAKLRFTQASFSKIIKPTTSVSLEKKFREYGVTDVVSFHFALTTSAVSAIRRLGNTIRLSVVVTDPFTAPPAWFYEKNIQYYVYSQQAKNDAVTNCGIPEHQISVAPFLIGKKFLTPCNPEELLIYKKKHGFPVNKKLVLLAGGGEGLPGAFAIVTECAKNKAKFSLAVVCGHDKATYNNLKLLKLAYPYLDLHVFGFVSFMDELIKSCDCAVIKAGPATLMEVLHSKKPVIISTYIHGQELGNVRFAVEHNCGWFIQKPKAIFEKINNLFSDDQYYDKIQSALEKLPIEINNEKFARILMENQ